MRIHTVVGAVRTAYLDIGDGEPIVALHGIPTSSLLFDPLAPHLEGFRLIAPDLLGAIPRRHDTAGSTPRRIDVTSTHSSTTCPSSHSISWCTISARSWG